MLSFGTPPRKKFARELVGYTLGAGRKRAQLLLGFFSLLGSDGRGV